MKPIYKILIIAGAVILIGVIIYFAWQSFAGPGTTTPVNPTQNPNLPLSGANNTTPNQIQSGLAGPLLTSSALKKLSDGPVFDFWTIPSTGEVYYLTPDGRVFSAKDGPDLLIADQTVNALNKIEASPNGQKLLASFGDPRLPQWGIFDVIDKVWRPLPAEILNATWGADNNQLIATVKNNTQTNLSLVDATKTPPTYKIIIKDFRFKDVNFVFEPPQSLFIFEKPATTYAGRVWQLDIKSLFLNLIFAPEKDLTLGWSQDKKVAFRFYQKGASLVLFNGGLQPMRTEASFTTLPEKCTEEASTTYCFQPQNIPANTILPDDYLEKAFYPIDDLLTLDLSTDNFSRILSSGVNKIPPLDGYHPQILGGALYFINRFDNYLYELQFQNQ